MDEVLSQEVFARIVTAVSEHAHSLGVGGFLIVGDLETGQARFAVINKDRPLRIGVPGKRDVNYAAIAGSKFGFVVAHRRDTGTLSESELLLGEFGWQGGRLGSLPRTRDRFVFSFSGATQEIDLELAGVAETCLQGELA